MIARVAWIASEAKRQRMQTFQRMQKIESSKGCQESKVCKQGKKCKKGEENDAKKSTNHINKKK